MASDPAASRQPPIKLLQIGKYFFPDQGGVETVTQAISDALWPHGIQADVLCFSRRRDYPAPGLPYQIIRAKTDFRLSNKSFSVDYVRKIAALAPQYDAALLHVPNPIGMLGALRLWKNKPLLVLWHADITTYPLLGRVLRGYERALIRQSAGVIVPTDAHVSGSYVAQELAAKATVIPFPFDRTRLPLPNRSAPGISRVRQFAGSRRIVLSVGRLVGYKGFDVLVASASRLADDLCVVIAGSGPLAGALQAEVVRQNAGGKVLLLGSVDDADLAALYEAAYAVAVPSVTRAEMYGVTQVEAMSFARPVVSTNIPGSGVSQVNLHDETGLVVTPGDCIELADALNRLAKDEQLYRRLSVGAERSIRETHDLSRAGGKVAALVRSVLPAAATRGQS